ncbi:hypothetical protein ACWGH3_10345 [Streptomyces sp. NPDC054884]|uniref:hypothetical protein n=1 Tax=Streptomyces sp. ME08-AFT2 TaxID=3028683 RepID=UPI0029B0A8EC|nr:hypothetical protein [Streptomyces sp. ME08-AFT2]MDX3315293.1 hypothetical protein [Streptomyces sp. ME08-AFT2]
MSTILRHTRDSVSCKDRVRRLTSAADTNKHEQQRSAAGLSGRSAEAQTWLTDVDGPL